MRFTHTLPLVLALGLAACSGDSKDSTPTFTDPVAAMDQADAAAASGNASTAQAGYEYAAENGDTKLQGDALLALLNLNLNEGLEEAATSVFGRLSDGFSDRLDADRLVSLCDAAVNNKLAGIGDAIVAYAMEAHPDITARIAKQSIAFERLRTEGPGVDLSDLGYAGD